MPPESRLQIRAPIRDQAQSIGNRLRAIVLDAAYDAKGAEHQLGGDTAVTAGDAGDRLERLW